MPVFPSTTITRENAINQILSSIAMEELGLSHIINAEGEKLQYIVGTLNGSNALSEPVKICDLIKINNSICATLEAATQTQVLLKSKLEKVLSAAVMEGPPGEKGDTGEKGPAGATGAEGKSAYEVAVYNGFEGTEADWLNSLKASSVTIIPFASQQAPYVGANASGKPVNVALLGFGYLGFNTGIGGENAHVAIPITPSDGSFNLGASGNDNKQVVFSMPFDMKLNSIYMTTGNWERFSILIPAGTEVFPYVQIYTAPAGTNTFLPLNGAIAKPTEGLHPESAQAATMLKAEISGLEIELKAGTRIAICGMMEIIGDSASRDYYLYFTGGIGLSN